ncbi:MAG: DUF1848 domain-containing protein [Mycobacterium leprae]
MIISASYKTDIPAFYGDWFMRRLKAGFCEMVNPYGGQLYRIPLTPDQVDGFVFWTKNVGPFLPHLAEIRRMGYPFMVHYGISAYPRVIEPRVAPADRAVAHMRQLAESYGPRVAVWRYDPILITSLTPVEFHRRNFATLAAQLAGTTDEVVISFAQIYRKTERNLSAAARLHGFTWEDPADAVKCELTGELVAIARSHGMELSVCSQAAYCVSGAAPARCVDARRLSDVAGRKITARRQGNRPDCGCDQSRDIGAYDTCPHGCVYCYAVQSPAAAKRSLQSHNPESLRLGD